MRTVARPVYVMVTRPLYCRSVCAKNAKQSVPQYWDELLVTIYWRRVAPTDVFMVAYKRRFVKPPHRSFCGLLPCPAPTPSRLYRAALYPFDAPYRRFCPSGSTGCPLPLMGLYRGVVGLCGTYSLLVLIPILMYQYSTAPAYNPCPAR